MLDIAMAAKTTPDELEAVTQRERVSEHLSPDFGQAEPIPVLVAFEYQRAVATRRRSSAAQFSTTATSVGGAESSPAFFNIRNRCPSADTS
jgi:hypothetical protein